MSITFEERDLSHEAGKTTGYDVSFIARGDTDINAIRAAAMASYATYGPDLLPLDRVRVLPLGNEDSDVWTVDISYKSADGSSEQKEAGDSSFTFDTGGGTQHLTQSYGTQRYNNLSSDMPDAPNLKNAINATQDGVAGVDVIIPQFEFEVVRYFASGDLTSTALENLYKLTGKTNSTTVTTTIEGLDFVFEPGELLFYGARGSKRSKGDWEIVLKFGFSPNEADLFPDLTTGGDFDAVEKAGWQYVWTLYEDQADNTAKKMVKKPLGIYVEDVYKSADLNPLFPT